jgi:hypothetical protein
MTPKTETDTRYAGRSGAGVAPAHAPQAPTATGLARRGPAIAWSHVLPLGILLAFANGFWIVVLRGAVGAIERTSAPFSTWLHESSLLAPVYVAAVLVAFLVAQRWFGPRPRTLRAMGGTIATVSALATAAGVALLMISSWFDYRLQATDLHHMSAAHPGCDSSCLTARVHATVSLELKALWIGLILMFLTDLVLISLVVAFRGGALVLSRTPQATGAPRVADARLVLGAGLLGTALVNAAVVPQHVHVSAGTTLLLGVLALAQAGAAAAVVLAPKGRRRLALLAGAVVCAVPLLAWSLAATTGVPLVHESAKLGTLSSAGTMAGLLEVVCLAMAVTLLLRRRPAVAWNRHATAIAVSAVLGATLVGIGGSTLPTVSAFASLDDPPRLHAILLPQG